MPFKSSKIVYGLPQDAYAQQTVNAYLEDLKQTVHLTNEPVGVKFLFTDQEYEACPVPELRGSMAYCVMVKQATRGISCKSCLEHHKCDGGTTALALERSTEHIENGAEYFSYNLYATQTAARRHRAQIASLHAELPLTRGIVIGPLKSFTVTPDVIILVVNPYQAMRLVQGYEYETGIKPCIDMGAMQAMCAECTAYPYKSGSMNVSVLCPSTRILCGWDHSDMAVGIPFEQFTRIVAGVVSTAGTVDKPEKA
ncbi:MAG: DUF169 domain-containing protein [Bacillota bacterium]